MSDDRLIKIDRMRYTKNSLSSGLALLAILFDVFFFVSIYQSDVGSFYYTILIGASVLYNLVFMLLTFLSSEGVKNYKRAYSWLLLALGAGQIVRIFILPMKASKALYAGAPVMGGGQFAFVVGCLCISSACCIASAVINLLKSRQLEKHIASLGEKAV